MLTMKYVIFTNTQGFIETTTATVPVKKLIPFGTYPDGSMILWALLRSNKCWGLSHYETGRCMGWSTVNKSLSFYLRKVFSELASRGITEFLTAIKGVKSINKIPKHITITVPAVADLVNRFMSKTAGHHIYGLDG